MTTLSLTALAGTHINRAAQDALDLLADDSDAEAVEFTFNSIPLRVTRDDTPASVYGRFMEGMEAAANTPEAIAARKASEARISAWRAEAQARLDEVMAQVGTLRPMDLASPRWTATWIGSFADATDTMGVIWDAEKLCDLLESAGYRANEFTSRDPDAAEVLRAHLDADPSDRYRYLIGQAISCLRGPVRAIHGVYGPMLAETHKLADAAGGVA